MMKHEDHFKIQYQVCSAKFDGNKLVSVGVQCSEVGSPFGYESDTLTLHELIELIKSDEKVEGLWPAGQVWNHWPLEVIVMHDGTESVEAVDKNRPERFKLSALTTSRHQDPINTLRSARTIDPNP